MRRCALLPLALLLALSAPASCLHAQDKNGSQMKVMPQAELDVVKVLLAQERAWNAGKLDEFVAGYKSAPDTVFMGSALERGFDSILQQYRKNYPDRASMGVLSFADLEPRLLDEHFAVLTGRFSLERTRKAGGPAAGLFSLVLEKTAGGWKIVLDHTT